MQFTTEFWVQILVYAVTFAAAWGSAVQRIKSLEKKVEKHNGVMERTFRLEESEKSAHHRIDELREGIERVQEQLSNQ